MTSKCVLMFAGAGPEADINQMDNICFQGTLVTDGNGSGMVVCTGENSQFGEIFKKMQSEEPPRYAHPSFGSASCL